MGDWTYKGSTWGATVGNAPVLIAAAIGGVVNWVSSGSTADPMTYGKGAKMWFYVSTNAGQDGATGVINDGPALGMKPGDLLFGVTSTAGSTAPLSYMAVLVSSGGSTSFSFSSSVVSSTCA